MGEDQIHIRLHQAHDGIRIFGCNIQLRSRNEGCAFGIKIPVFIIHIQPNGHILKQIHLASVRYSRCAGRIYRSAPCILICGNGVVIAGVTPRDVYRLRYGCIVYHNTVNVTHRQSFPLPRFQPCYDFINIRNCVADFSISVVHQAIGYCQPHVMIFAGNVRSVHIRVIGRHLSDLFQNRTPMQQRHQLCLLGHSKLCYIFFTGPTELQIINPA